MKKEPVFSNVDLSGARPPTGQFSFLKSPLVLKLPTGELFLESDLDVDCDGRWSHNDQDRDGQKDTSLHESDGRALDASLTPFFVLPKWFADKHGVRLGDYAIVAYKGKSIAAILGDFGPKKKLGEASLAVHDALGNPNFVNGRYRNIGIDAGVQTVVFPGSGDGSVPSAAQIQTKGKALLDRLVGAGLPKVAIQGRNDLWGDSPGELVTMDAGHRRVLLRAFAAWALQVAPSAVPATWDGKTASLGGVVLKSSRRKGEEPVTAHVAEIMAALGYSVCDGANEVLATFQK